MNMADLKLNQRWKFETSTQELRLITKALDGRLRQDEKEEARELGLRLTKTRVAVSKNVLSKVQELENNVNAGFPLGKFGASRLGISLQKRLTEIETKDRAAYHVWQIMEWIVVNTTVSELCAATRCKTELSDNQIVTKVVVLYSAYAGEVLIHLDTETTPTLDPRNFDGTDLLEPMDDLWDEYDPVPYINRLNEILELIQARY
jgi:hypothetical protein